MGLCTLEINSFNAGFIRQYRTSTYIVDGRKPAVQSRKVVTAYLKIKQLLPFGFARSAVAYIHVQHEIQYIPLYYIQGM